MSRRYARGGRPMGAAARAVLDLLRVHAMAARDIALALRLTVRAVVLTASRLVQRGKLYVAELRRMAGAKRPLAVYALCRVCSASRVLDVAPFGSMVAALASH